MEGAERGEESRRESWEGESCVEGGRRASSSSEGRMLRERGGVADIFGGGWD